MSHQTKKCSDCKEVKPLTEFPKNRSAKDGLQGTCKVCHNTYQVQWRQDNPGAFRRIRRKAHLKSLYGIAIEEYDELLGSQGGTCAICKESPGNMRLAVDHSHKTGKVRGLLCSGCNSALGSFKDSPVVLDQASQYLKASGWV